MPPYTEQQVAASAHAPAYIASQVKVSQYILIGTIGALTWDLVCHAKFDLKLLFMSRVRPATIIYLSSRIAVLATVLGYALFYTIRTSHCQSLQVFNAVSYSIGTSLTSLLFFLRVKAVFSGNRLVSFLFFFLWLAVAGTSITPILGPRSKDTVELPNCVSTLFGEFIGDTALVTLLYDTLVFIALSWRLLMLAHWDSDRSTIELVWRDFFWGKNLSRLTKTLLKDGQVYYLLSLFTNAAVFADYSVSIASSDPTTRSGFFTLALMTSNLFLTNALACHVYRHTRNVLLMARTTQLPPITTLHFGESPSTNPRHDLLGDLGSVLSDMGGSRDVAQSMDSHQASTASTVQTSGNNSEEIDIGCVMRTGDGTETCQKYELELGSMIPSSSISDIASNVGTDLDFEKA